MNNDVTMDGRASVLASRSQGSGVGEDEIVRLLKPIAEALDYAHTEGVVHRDIKPANVMIRKDGRPFIMDFGIAREIQETMTFVTGKMSSGTLMYMSPEQLHGHAPKKFQDIYSFAAMVYECLTGRPPFCRGQIEYQIDHDDPEPLSNEIAIASSVMAGLAKKPEDRPKSCVEVLSGDYKERDNDSEGLSKRSPLSEAKPLETCDSPHEPQVEPGIRIPFCSKFFGKITVMSLFSLGLVGGILWYYHRQEEQYTQLAIEAFKSDRWEEGFSLTKKADHNNKEIQFYLGKCYAKGKGVVKDEREAVKWYRKAAEQGNAKAQNNLGVMYVHGEGVAKDDYEAVKWYRKSAEQGNARAQCNLGGMYENGRGVTKDDYEAVKWYRKSAEQGYGRAQCYLGWMYQYGRGVAKDESEAVKWYRKSAEQGEKYAQCYLGWMYQYGRGVAKDESEAVKWYRKSAEQGEKYAQFNLGLMYEEGCGVTKDEYEAVKWYRKSAEQGFADAQYKLGSIYQEGRGLVPDNYEAVKWYRRSAEQGNVDGQSSLGMMYYHGWGVLEDYYEAIKWLRKTAEQGDSMAQFYLGLCYAYGYGVLRDGVEAAKWYRKAADQGIEVAEKELKRLGY